MTTQSEFLLEIDQAWQALLSYLAGLSEAQMTALRDNSGWTVKDHLTHIVAWEQSILFHFQGKPRHQAVGLDEAFFASRDFDAQNEAIRSQREHLSLDEVLAQLRQTHAELMAFVRPLTDADLARPYRDYPPETPASDRRSVMDLVRGDTSEHFTEHLAWIKALVTAASDR
ncbi:MAG: ClbS/DfsB family four-helix bundle protein [Chloroflexi bacterium]|nr:ClbS/DfsB family four-helix bundle protein [Chloroflexota bacterium]